MKQKIIFMGTPDFAATVLAGLIESGAYEILRVVTQPDRKVGRKHVLQATPVGTLAVLSGLTTLKPEKLSGSLELTELLELAAREPYGIVTAAFGQFLPGKLLDAVAFSLNVHASLLPKYRGGAPIHYALINGDAEAGVTLMEMVRKMDAGDMLSQRAIPITAADNVGTLFDRLAVVGRDLLLEKLPDYLSGALSPVAQDAEKVSFSPNIQPEEELIDWTKPARAVFNQIRGMNPWPVSHTIWRGERLKIYEAEVVDGAGNSGTVIERSKKRLVVACGAQAVSLRLVQPAGKPKMAIGDFLNGAGRDISEGERFGDGN
ncbi:MAG: methionyl-tRNA formyltransferase [Streptococcaceae bacterium]|jgi:methionyl-tRNA formyltransferase|nr:methionyl-tRNA formyltransferase [Streptococcaceae bacterium]